MLQKLNERLQGIVAWVIISIIAMTFTLFGIEYYVQSHQTSDHTVLEVNGFPITKEMVDVRVERARRGLQEDDATFHSKSARQQAINELVASQVALQSARKNGFYIGDAMVQQAIFSLPEFSENGHFSLARYQQVLTGAMYSHDEFQRELQQEMLLQQQRFMFLATEFILPTELRSYVRKNDQARQYKYLEIPLSLFSKAQEVSVAEQQEYYQQHQRDFMSSEAVRLAYIRLSIPDIRSKINVKSEELKQFYRENTASFSEKGKTKPFNQVKKQIEAQLVNEKVQVEYARLVEALSDMSYQSSDELNTTAEALGLKVEQTEFFTKSSGTSALTQNPQVLNLAFSQTFLKAGENSQPLQLNPETVIVFRVLEHKPSEVLPFDAVKQQVHSILIREKSVQAASVWGEKLLKADENEYIDWMKNNQLSWRDSGLQTREQSADNPSVRDLAFSVENIGGTVGKLLSLDANRKAYVVVKLEKIVDGSFGDLSAEKKQTLQQQLSFNQGVLTYDAYLMKEKEHSVIKTK